MAHQIVEAGADLVLSHHAHVLQPLEYYRPQRDPERTAVIAYSLGNLTTSFSAPHLVLSGILNLTLVKGKAQGKEKTVVKEARLIPVVQRESREGDLPALRLEKLETLSAGKGGSKEEMDYIAAIKEYAALVL